MFAPGPRKKGTVARLTEGAPRFWSQTINYKYLMPTNLTGVGVLESVFDRFERGESLSEFGKIHGKLVPQ